MTPKENNSSNRAISAGRNSFSRNGNYTNNSK